MPKLKDLNKRPLLSDTEIVTIFNLMYVFHIPYLDARACIKDEIAEKLISLWIDFEKKARQNNYEAKLTSDEVKKDDKGSMEKD